MKLILNYILIISILLACNDCFSLSPKTSLKEKERFNILLELEINIDEPDYDTIKKFIMKTVADGHINRLDPNISGGQICWIDSRTRFQIIDFAIYELLKNLREYSNHYATLSLQFIEITPGHKAMRIVAKNDGIIKDPLGALSGFRRRYVSGGLGWESGGTRGMALYILNRVAKFNRGIVLKIASDELMITTSYLDMSIDESTRKGTEVQFIVSFEYADAIVTDLLNGRNDTLILNSA